LLKEKTLRETEGESLQKQGDYWAGKTLTEHSLTGMHQITNQILSFLVDNKGVLV